MTTRKKRPAKAAKKKTVKRAPRRKAKGSKAAPKIDVQFIDEPISVARGGAAGLGDSGDTYVCKKICVKMGSDGVCRRWKMVCYRG